MPSTDGGRKVSLWLCLGQLLAQAGRWDNPVVPFFCANLARKESSCSTVRRLFRKTICLERSGKFVFRYFRKMCKRSAMKMLESG